MKIRDANSSDYNAIFMMGYDVWSDGLSVERYLHGCNESPKYKKGQWKVLEDNGTLLSSLIVYKLNENGFGIGSIATPEKLRRQGWGSKITAMASEQLELEEKSIFLFADIKPDFYEKLGYVSLPKEFQEYKSSICMVRTNFPEQVWGEVGFQAPKYF